MDPVLLLETYGGPAYVENLVPVEPETETITYAPHDFGRRAPSVSKSS
jgi:hypothetical protein